MRAQSASVIRMVKEASLAEMALTLSSLWSTCVSTMAKNIMKRFDVDGDGEISLEEFQQVMDADEEDEQ